MKYSQFVRVAPKKRHGPRKAGCYIQHNPSQPTLAQVLSILNADSPSSRLHAWPLSLSGSVATSIPINSDFPLPKVQSSLDSLSFYTRFKHVYSLPPATFAWLPGAYPACLLVSCLCRYHSPSSRLLWPPTADSSTLSASHSASPTDGLQSLAPPVAPEGRRGEKSARPKASLRESWRPRKNVEVAAGERREMGAEKVAVAARWTCVGRGGCCLHPARLAARFGKGGTHSSLQAGGRKERHCGGSRLPTRFG